MVPKTAAGRRIRDTLARLPLMRVLAAVQRLAPTRRRPTLPDYIPARLALPPGGEVRRFAA
jgi:hypothetical protein